MSESRPGLHFEPEWRITLFTLLMVPFMVGLGFWQLQRADEKAQLAATFDERQHDRPRALSAVWDDTADSLAFMPVRVSGTFLPDKYFLVDNKVENGQVGYEVLGILQLPDAAGSVLVNRGWVAGDAARRFLPDVPAVDGLVEVTGQVYVAPGSPYLLAEQQLEVAWPKRIQAVEMDKLVPEVEALLGARVFPFPLRINAGEKAALRVNWQVVNMNPQKHQGYAVQWFVMAAVLLVFYLLRSSNLWQFIFGREEADK